MHALNTTWFMLCANVRATADSSAAAKPAGELRAPRIESHWISRLGKRRRADLSPCSANGPLAPSCHQPKARTNRHHLGPASPALFLNEEKISSRERRKTEPLAAPSAGESDDQPLYKLLHRRRPWRTSITAGESTLRRPAFPSRHPPWSQ
ncbi:uncharacterized protein TrAtP1_011089 [Trichoderma atroviride]|uniref:uncharacterized protein n=1 Tax=Hypocrea atroviridis TaxID=63577 RepID=UPI00332BE782|nr:hypothetical protein TrAtP1_011089 [Trichoderma atroviride]